MFWKHIDKIHRKHVYRSESVEYRSMKLMVTESLIVILAVVLFSVTLSFQYSDELDVSNLSQMVFWGSGLSRVTNLTNAWYWVTHDLTSQVFSSSSSFSDSVTAYSAPEDWLSMTAYAARYSAQANGLFSLLEYPAWSPYFVGGDPFRGNVLLGPVRLRQCAPPGKSAPMNLSEDALKAYDFQMSNVTQQSEMISSRGVVFPASGYVLDFVSSLSGTRTILDEVWNSSWVNNSTEGFVIEISVLNTRKEVVANSIILMEVVDKSVGSVYAELQSEPIRIPTSGLPVSFVLNIATFAMFTAFAIFLIDLLQLVGFVDFFTYAWNLLDFVIVVLYYVYIGKFLSVSSDIPSILAPIVSPVQSVFRPFSYYSEVLVEQRRLEAILIVLLWTRVTKILTLIKPFRVTVKVTEKMVFRIALFVLPVAVIVAFIFATIFYTVYPGMFLTVWDAFYGVCFMHTHSLDIFPFLAEKPGVSAVILIFFILLSWILLPAVCLTVALRSYRTYQEEVREAKDLIASNRLALYPPGVDMNKWWHKDVVTAFIYTWVLRIRGIELYKEPDEDIGYPEEQDIDLSLLPDIVQTRWSDKRAELVEAVEAKRPAKKLLSSGSSKFGNRMSKLMSSLSKAQSRLLGKIGDVVSRKNLSMTGTVSSSANIDIITRIQLQRLLDADPELCEMLKDCSSGRVRAIDVIRKFKTPAAASKAMIVAAIMASSGLKQTTTTSGVKQGLNSVLTDLETSWKEEFASVVDAVTAITEDLVELSQLVDQRFPQPRPGQLQLSRRSSTSN